MSKNSETIYARQEPQKICRAETSLEIGNSSLHPIFSPEHKSVTLTSRQGLRGLQAMPGKACIFPFSYVWKAWISCERHLHAWRTRSCSQTRVVLGSTWRLSDKIQFKDTFYKLLNSELIPWKLDREFGIWIQMWYRVCPTLKVNSYPEKWCVGKIAGRPLIYILGRFVFAHWANKLSCRTRDVG